MAAVEMRADLSDLLQAIIEQDDQQLVRVSRELLADAKSVDVLIGRIGLIAARGDADGHVVAALGAAAMLARAFLFVPDPLDPQAVSTNRALPLFVQAMRLAGPAVRLGNDRQPEYPEPFFPGLLLDSEQTVNGKLLEAIENDDALMVERLLLGFYGTGADYRTLQSRTYEGISTFFPHSGHPMILASRGFQILDAVEWGKHMPEIIHWLSPHLPLAPDVQQPEWIINVQNYIARIKPELDQIRKRISFPTDDAAIPLRSLIQSDVDTDQVLDAIYNTLFKREASAQAIASMLTLVAADILAQVDDSDHETFINVSHGLLFTAAVRVAVKQVQEVEIYPLLFTAAAYLNALGKAIASYLTPQKQERAQSSRKIVGGGFIGASQLEVLAEQLKASDYSDAWNNIQRYLSLKHDVRALFGTIAQVAAYSDTQKDQGHALLLVQAVHESYLNWPQTLAQVNIEPLLHAALRAVVSSPRDEFIVQL